MSILFKQIDTRMDAWKVIKLYSAFVLLPLLLSNDAWAQYFGDKKYGEYYEEEKIWVEAEAALPEIPGIGGFVEYFVSAASPNKYLVAPQTISIAPDGVVRYVAAVKTPSGVINISFEGLRCATKEIRLYAFGRPDGNWGKSRNERWAAVRPGSYQATLFKEYFCPGGIAIITDSEGAEAIRQGGHPQVK